MTRITVRDLKQNPSRWLQRARSGERIEVAPGGDDSQVVVLVPLAAAPRDPWQPLEELGVLTAATGGDRPWPVETLDAAWGADVLSARATDHR